MTRTAMPGDQVIYDGSAYVILSTDDTPAGTMANMILISDQWIHRAWTKNIQLSEETP